MNNSWKKIVGVSFLVGCLYIGTASANSTTPGSVEDPLITKSYLDEQINKLKTELGQSGSLPVSTGGAELVVESMSAGQVLLAGAGTEVIVRSGHAVGISVNGNGIPNLTAGTDIKDTQIPLNHLLLFPRNDGRGIKIIKGPSHVMIRGSYQIVNP